MRVIAGSARGTRLRPIPGMDTRPTTSRVKESIFNIIQSEVPGAAVLDLFAGTGQLGVEALSRGAAHCDFVERDRRAIKVLRENIAAARVCGRAAVHESDAMAFLSGGRAPQYDLILLDPPYGEKILKETLFAINRFDILSPSGIILCESAQNDEFGAPFICRRTYRYGTIQITVLHRPQDAFHQSRESEC